MELVELEAWKKTAKKKVKLFIILSFFLLGLSTVFLYSIIVSPNTQGKVLLIAYWILVSLFWLGIGILNLKTAIRLKNSDQETQMMRYSMTIREKLEIDPESIGRDN